MNEYLIDLIIKDWESKGWCVTGKHMFKNIEGVSKLLMYHPDLYTKAYVYLYFNTMTFGVAAHYDVVGEVLLSEFNNYDDCMYYIKQMEK